MNAQLHGIKEGIDILVAVYTAQQAEQTHGQAAPRPFRRLKHDLDAVLAQLKVAATVTATAPAPTTTTTASSSSEYERGVRDTELRMKAMVEQAYRQGVMDKGLEMAKVRGERKRDVEAGVNKLLLSEQTGRAKHLQHESTEWHLRYFDELLRMTSAADLLDAEVFNINGAAKELTEAFASFSAVRQHLIGPDGFDPKDKDVTVLVVGDGSTPRAGCTFAVRTQWTVHSIDPQMRTTGPWTTVRRLTTHTAKIEDCRFAADKVVIVMVHCHVAMDDVLHSLEYQPKVLGVVSAPCCHFSDLQTHVYGHAPIADFEDVSMQSGRREIRVWHVKKNASVIQN